MSNTAIFPFYNLCRFLIWTRRSNSRHSILLQNINSKKCCIHVDESGQVVVLAFRGFICWAATWQNKQNDCAPSEDSDQPGHPLSLIRVFAVRIKKALILSYPLSAQRRLWSDWADAQADLSLRWVHTHFVGFVMSWLSSRFMVGWDVVEGKHN